jgi:Zn-dependent protease with chaperone function
VSQMDFFAHQDAARRATKRLVLLFALAVLGMTACVHFVAIFVFGLADDAEAPHAKVFAFAAGGTLAVVGLGALARIAELRRGGGAVARMLGGREVDLDPADPKERLLRNLVEEMAIASGTPTPSVYVLDDERGLNAFAAGWTPDDAAIAVTRGLLDELDRDELQGVVAHEFSHVFHGDMRLNIRLMGALAGILCLVTIGRAMMRVRGGRKNEGAGIAALGVALCVIGWLGVLFARLIQSAISRQREFLADASAVQYTRNPRGIGMALARIGGLGAKVEHARAEEASHMLFADGMSRFFGGLFASHPPIRARIERVLPGFLAQTKTRGSLAAAVAATPTPDRAAPATGVHHAGAAGLLAAVGDPQPADVDAARALLASLPMALATAAHEPRAARALACALLLDDDDAIRQEQVQRLAPADAALRHDAQALRRDVATLGHGARLPLLELATPALRRLPAAERAQLGPTLRALAEADGDVAPFEWALLRLAERALAPDGAPARRPHGRPVALFARADAATTLLSVLAHAGAAGDALVAADAFQRGAQALGAPRPLRLRPRAECTIAALDAAVDELGDVSPLGRKNLLAACAATAAADFVLSADETDLLRALASVWDCPMPLAVAR